MSRTALYAMRIIALILTLGNAMLDLLAGIFGVWAGKNLEVNQLTSAIGGGYLWLTITGVLLVVAAGSILVKGQARFKLVLIAVTFVAAIIATLGAGFGVIPLGMTAIALGLVAMSHRAAQ